MNMKTTLATKARSVIARVKAYQKTERGQLRTAQVRNVVPLLVLFAMGLAREVHAQTAPAAAVTALQNGFGGLYDLAAKIIGYVVLAVASYFGFLWVTGKPEAMNKCIGTAIAGLVIVNLKSFLGIFGFTFS